MPPLRTLRWLLPASAAGLAAGVGLGAFLLLGPVLLDVQAPAGAATVGLEGVEVFLRFDAERTRHATFRALLNGADVTDELEVAPNGVHGSLHGLLHGDNELRFEVYGEGYWPPDLLVEETRSYSIRYRPPLDLDRG